MRYVCNCGEDVHPKRRALGYKTCLDCGDKVARQKIAEKSMRIVQMHKSSAVYLGDDPKIALQTVRDITQMRRSYE